MIKVITKLFLMGMSVFLLNNVVNSYGQNIPTIQILSAQFGAKNKYCDATKMFQERCDGKTSCSVSVTKEELCGDPILNVVKEAKIHYRCSDGIQQTIAVREYNMAELNCVPRSENAISPITILSVQYGAKGKFCNATNDVAEICKGRTSCTIYVNNDLCGDPILNVKKEANIIYQCHGNTSQQTVFVKESNLTTITCPEVEQSSFTTPINSLEADSITWSGKKVALVIGNSRYINAPLSNPGNDAQAISRILQRLGFEVMVYENLTEKEMKQVIDTFGDKVNLSDIGLFFYSGHGLQVKGENYLMPIDANPKSENDVEYNCIHAGRILGKMEDAKSKTNIIILDACRNNPFEKRWTKSPTSQGLAMMIY